MRPKNSSCLVIILSLIIPLPVQARLITSAWPQYRTLERLMSCGEIEPFFYGQRLWTQKDVYTKIKDIDSSNPRGICGTEIISSLISQLKNFKTHVEEQGLRAIKFTPLSEAQLTYSFIPKGDAIYPNNGRGTINATINSFREDTQGKLLGLGHELSLTSDHELILNKLKLTAFLQLETDLLVKNNFQEIGNKRFTPHQAYTLIEPTSLFFVIGRAPVIWGQGDQGGFLFSENARPLDHVQFSHKPGQLPAFLRHLGKWKTSLIFGNLGPEVSYTWSFFTGLSVGVKPIEDFEANMTHIFQFGGVGSPDISPGFAVREFFGFIPYLSQSSQGGTNKITGLNFRYFLNKFMGAQFYLDYFMDDANFSSGWAPFKKHFFHNSSYSLGTYFTRPFASLNDTLRLEFTSTGPIAYRHGEFVSGWTVNQNIIGNPLGPDGLKISAVWEHKWSNLLTNDVTLRWARRDSNTYVVSANGESVSVATDGPEEMRSTLLYGNQFLLPHFDVLAKAGYEWIRNYSFQQGNTEHSFLFTISLRKEFE